MNKLLSLLLLVFGYLSVIQAQEIQTVAFYNVENLFDTIDGPNDDAEFLPAAAKQWNTEKYNAKLQQIRQVMEALQMPIIMGVCEIENKGVIAVVIFVSLVSRNSTEWHV